MWGRLREIMQSHYARFYAIKCKIMQIMQCHVTNWHRLFHTNRHSEIEYYRKIGHSSTSIALNGTELLRNENNKNANKQERSYESLSFVGSTFISDHCIAAAMKLPMYLKECCVVEDQTTS